jgi:hypothetical protein
VDFRVIVTVADGELRLVEDPFFPDCAIDGQLVTIMDGFFFGHSGNY